MQIRRIEPFCLFGPDSYIFTKEQAAKVAVDNSYYFFIAGCILLLGPLSFLIGMPLAGVPISYLAGGGIFYLSMAFAIRRLKSRVAAILIFAAVAGTLISRLLQFDTGGFFIFNLLFFAASIRAIKATFFFHKNLANSHSPTLASAVWQ